MKTNHDDWRKSKPKPKTPRSKVRRPNIFLSEDLTAQVIIDEYGSDISFGMLYNIKTISEAKRLHAWLTRAIAYLESKEG